MGEANVEHNAMGFIIMIGVGVIFAISAILPGLSHSTVLLVLGLMSTFTAAISDLDFFLLVPILLGLLAGALGFSKVIHKALEDHHLVTIKQKPASFRSKMEFGSIQLARDLFDGKVNAVACIGEGTIEMHGLINMIDNLNRILDRVALYLA